jgi:glycosyl hydrolase family 113
MTDAFQFQGFGVLSEWNGQVKSPTAQIAMQNIANDGANSIEIVPRIWTSTASSNDVLSVPDKTESDASLIQGIANAHADGLAVILKPNISTLDGSGSMALAPSDVGAFFASYKTEIVHLAEIAQQTGTEVLALGNEMSSLTGAQYKGYWTDIIQSVRAVYHGELTYAAATDEASKVSFWDELDTIGVNTYPPLAVTGEPTVAKLVDAWNEVPANPYWATAFDHQSPIDFLQSLSAQYGKQILMTEAGYRSIDAGSTITGSWTTTGPIDLQLQADAYAAFLQVIATHGGSWLQGVEFWQWDMNGRLSPTGFSPMGKPAEAIVTEYFKGFGGLASADVTSLTHDQIAQLADAGIKTIAATDHDVTISRAEAADLAAAHISLSEAYGQGSQTLTWNADGSLHDVHYFIPGTTSISDYDVAYDAQGKPVSALYGNGATTAWDYAGDGSLHEVIQNNITGKSFTTTDTVYGSDGKAASETWSNGATLQKTATWNADGSMHDVHYSNVTGHAYTDYDVWYGADGRSAFASYSNGMTETWSYNDDGSTHLISYAGVTGTNYGSYGAGYDNHQNVVQETGNNDGTETVHGYADRLTFTSGPGGETVTTGDGQSFNFAANAHTAITGNGQNETFVFKPGFGHDTINDFVPNAETNTNHDTIAFAAGTFADFNDLMHHAAQVGANTVITDAVGDSLTLHHVEMAHLTVHDFLLA